MNPNEGYEDFDWSTLSKKELDQLYHSIIDHTLKDSHYFTFVANKWNISEQELRKMGYVIVSRKELSLWNGLP